jgi:hypothetical protein
MTQAGPIGTLECNCVARRCGSRECRKHWSGEEIRVGYDITLRKNLSRLVEVTTRDAI